jgi:hypothetical protein
MQKDSFELWPGAMPEEIAAALYGTRRSTDQEPMPTPPLNPWLTKAGENGVLEYSSEELEEAKFETSLAAVRKLFEPAPSRQVPNLGELAPLPYEDSDDDEKEYYRALLPIQKLFHPTATSLEATQLVRSESDDWNEPLVDPVAKFAPPPAERNDNELPAEIQTAIELAISNIDPTSDEESIGDFFVRVDAELERLGHRPILSVL